MQVSNYLTLAAGAIVLVIAGCVKSETIHVPKSVGSDILPDGIYSWDDKSVGFVGNSLYYARYLPSQKIDEEGFVLVRDTTGNYSISFGPGMESFVVEFDNKVTTLNPDELRIGKKFFNFDKTKSIEIIDFDLFPLGKGSVGRGNAFRINRITLAFH